MIFLIHVRGMTIPLYFTKAFSFLILFHTPPHRHTMVSLTKTISASLYEYRRSTQKIPNQYVQPSANTKCTL